MSEITRILERIETDEPQAAEQLLPLAYQELRRLASRMMAREKPGQTLQPTALVHEAWLRLVDREHQQRWDSRRHFFAAAAEAMRRILVEDARRRGRKKRGGHLVRHSLDEPLPAPERTPETELLHVHEALDDLKAVAPQAAELVKLRYFAGCTIPEAAELLGVSPRKANGLWAYARAWLLDRLGEKP